MAITKDKMRDMALELHESLVGNDDIVFQLFRSVPSGSMHLNQQLFYHADPFLEGDKIKHKYKPYDIPVKMKLSFHDDLLISRRM